MHDKIDMKHGTLWGFSRQSTQRCAYRCIGQFFGGGFRTIKSQNNFPTRVLLWFAAWSICLNSLKVGVFCVLLCFDYLIEIFTSMCTCEGLSIGRAGNPSRGHRTWLWRHSVLQKKRKSQTVITDMSCVWTVRIVWFFKLAGCGRKQKRKIASRQTSSSSKIFCAANLGQKKDSPAPRWSCPPQNRLSYETFMSFQECQRWQKRQRYRVPCHAAVVPQRMPLMWVCTLEIMGANI